ncbi:MAG: heparan-alpha-glucosaminide N-acetyltransferase domain-containing protein [Myxococcota bacterium]
MSPAVPKKRRRVVAIDIGRGSAVIGMAMVHTLWMYGDIATQRDSWLGVLLHLMGKATTLFLVAMGFSYMLSRRQDLAGSIRRGLSILLLGYAMNFLKFVVPIGLGTMPDAFIAAYGWSSPLSPAQYLHLVLTGDILQLAGLALIGMGLVRRFTPSKPALLAWAAFFAWGSHLVRGLRLGVPGVDYGLDLLWGTEFNVYFPLFPWFAPILTGMFFGAWYLEDGRDDDRLFRRMLWLGLALLPAGVVLSLLDPTTHFADFFHMGAGGMTYLVGLNLVAAWVFHRIDAPRRLPRTFGVIRYFSTRVTTMYVVQWVTICWGMGLVGYQTLGVGGVLVAIAAVLPLTVVIDRGLDRWIERPSRT